MEPTDLVSVPRVVPAPWRLAGSGLILVSWPDHGDPDLHRFTAPPLRPLALFGLCLTMFVDYWRSEAGPYRELLFIPGRFRLGERKRWSITRIYVSTETSAAGGRANWGIPKELADFSVEGGPEERRTVTVSDSGRRAALLEFEPAGPEFPVSSRLLPSVLLSLAQVRSNRLYEFAPRARGRLRPARLLRAESDPELFPRPGMGRLLAAFTVPSFEMEFPRPRITDSPL